MQLLERDDELARLQALLERATDGQGSLALVAGEPGIGKTSLVDELCRRAQAHARIVRGACDDLVTPRTLGPFHDLAGSGDGVLRTALVDGAGRETVLAAVATELSNPLRATVAVIEDAQWADEASLDVLRFLARRIGSMSTLLVVTYRDDLPDVHPLLALVGGLVGPAVARLTLTGLSVEAVAELAAGSPTPAPVLHEITGGNPFYVSEVLDAPGDDVPSTIREAVVARLATLAPTTRAALEQVSVAPRGVELELAHAVGLDAEAIAEAERLGLLVVHDAIVGFRHELVRRAVAGGTPAATLAAAHRRLLEVLEPARDDPWRLLHHAVGAGARQAVATHAPVAARRAVQAGAHRDASEAFTHALRHPQLLGPAERARLRTELAREQLLVNHLAAGMEEAERAVAEWEALDDPVGLGTALTVLAEGRYWGLEASSAVATARQAVGVLSSQPGSQELAQATSTLAFVLVMTNDFAEAAEVADQAVTAAAEADAPEVHAHALTQRGTARAMLGQDGMDDLEAALELAHDHGLHTQVMLASIGLASASFRAGRLAQAEQAMALGLEHAERHDLDTGVAVLRMMRAGLDLARGDWAVAEQGLVATVGDGQGTGWGETVAAALLARLRARQGDPGARQLLERAWSIAVRSGEIQRVGPVGAAWLEWGWLTGELHAVREKVDMAVEAARTVGHRWYLGELLRYRSLAEPGHTVDDEVPEPWASGIAGRWERAAEAWMQLGWPYERALEQIASDDPEALLEALTTLDRLGATATATMARRRLKRLGVARVPRGPRPQTREHPAGLTVRQVEVLELLAEGATNAQIAERLVLSVRTVDHHVSAILAKLGATSRREAVARAAELGARDGERPVPA